MNRRRIPYTAWALMLCAVAWNPFFIGPGGAERLERWDTTALASLALALTVGALADVVRASRRRPDHTDPSACDLGLTADTVSPNRKADHDR